VTFGGTIEKNPRTAICWEKETVKMHRRDYCGHLKKGKKTDGAGPRHKVGKGKMAKTKQGGRVLSWGDPRLGGTY